MTAERRVVSYNQSTDPIYFQSKVGSGRSVFLQVHGLGARISRGPVSVL
jgi:hypothetical protein